MKTFTMAPDEDQRDLRKLAAHLAAKKVEPGKKFISIVLTALLIGLIGGLELWLAWNKGICQMFPNLPPVTFWGAAFIAWALRYVGSCFYNAAGKAA